MILAYAHPFFELFYYNGASTRTNKDGQFGKTRKRIKRKEALFLVVPFQPS